MNAGRVFGIATVALGLGFVGGVWFVSSGLGFRFIPLPLPAPTSMPTSPSAARPSTLPKAVAVPEPANLNRGYAGLGPRADRVDLIPTPGCNWVIEPRPFRLNNEWLSTSAELALGGDSSIDAASGGLRYLLIQSTRKNGKKAELRPVFFDAEANRFVPFAAGHSISSSSDGVYALNVFHLNSVRQLAPEKVAYFGVERVLPGAAKQLVDAAQREAQQKKIAMLPPPRLGEPYPFDLIATDGKRVRVGDFRGKVVLVAVWGPGASGAFGWSPLKQIRQANKTDELAIVGVSFEGSIDEARESLAKSQIDGPLVVIPNDPTTRRIWSDGAGITQLPMFFLIDREGILRFTIGQPFDLQDCIDILFGRAHRQPLPKPVRAAKPAH